MLPNDDDVAKYYQLKISLNDVNWRYHMILSTEDITKTDTIEDTIDNWHYWGSTEDIT